MTEVTPSTSRRGVKCDVPDRLLLLEAVAAAMAAGATQAAACRELGVSVRTVQRYRRAGGGRDGRQHRRGTPPNAFTPVEHAAIAAVLADPLYASMPCEQIVACLADAQGYVASARSFYRAKARQTPQRRARRPRQSVNNSHKATGPNQVWCWDISYLPSPTRGVYFFLYLLIDIWSRRIVAAAVHDEELGAHAAALMRATCEAEGITRDTLTLHSDNGSPMRSATLLETLRLMGIAQSLSRPRVSDDNAYIEALFKTLKYCPAYPKSGQFASREEAAAWVTYFVAWYNESHLHSAIGYVTPAQRHRGEDVAILAQRAQVFVAARNASPSRWTAPPKSWRHTQHVWLNQPHTVIYLEQSPTMQKKAA